MIKILSPKKLNDMRKAGKIVAEALLVAEKMAKVGVTTREIDAAVEMHILKQGAKPSFKGYQGFPYTICASINEEVVHGRPSDRKLEEGDILSIDVGAVINGVHADAARTFPVGKISKNAQKLIDVTKECFFKSIENIKAGSKLNEIGKACQKHAELNGFSVVRQMVGHGIGEKLHMEPHVLNYDGYKGNGGTLLEG
ncbi:MAG: type I methionyl aminopeptidase, partial [Firmicutes bacterium]|nr:type I methionyl aminopeptidase [Bacillota bacterium]